MPFFRSSTVQIYLQHLSAQILIQVIVKPAEVIGPPYSVAISEMAPDGGCFGYLLR